MDKRFRNTMVVSVIALALVLIGVTYAYFSARITGLESASTISLTAGRMGIVYSEDDATVSVSNIYPREEAWITKQVTLTGWNTTDQQMKYELTLNVISNTFPNNYLTCDLALISSTNGTPASNKTATPINGTGNIKLGAGVFTNADGDTHVYELKLYFKDSGLNQNDGQGAIFNAKINVREYSGGKHCYTNDYVVGVVPTTGDEYVNGQYTYKYNYSRTINGGSTWTPYTYQNGWTAKLTDSESTDPVTTEFCAYINEAPVVNLSFMFAESQATSIDLSSFDTSNVDRMSYMFVRSKVTSLDFSSFDTSNVKYMMGMFNGTSATVLDLSPFDTSNVTNMSSMFWGNHSTSINLSSFNTSKVTNMATMFFRSSATSLDLSTFDTSNVTDMSDMFHLSSVTSLDLSSFDTSSVTNMSYMFNECPATTGYARTQLDADRFNNVAGSLSNGSNPNTYISNMLRFVVK